MAVEVSCLIDREKKNPLLRAMRITISWFHGLIGSDQKRVQAYPLNAAKETIHLLWDIGIVRFVGRKGRCDTPTWWGILAHDWRGL